MKTKFIHKKSFVISIIIIVAVALIAVGAIVYSFLAPKSISGDWELVVNPEITKATPDEVEDSDRVFYTFSNPSEYGDGVYKTYFDGGIEEGEYKLSEKDDKKIINLGTENLEYKITGSKLFGNAKLTITYPEFTDEQTGQKSSAQDYVFIQEKAPEYEKQSYDSFETDKALVSEWVSNERTLSYYVNELSYTETVKFYDNGIMTIHYESTDFALDRYMYYAYTAKDGTLTFSLVTDKETQYKVSYEFDKDGNLKFTEDNTSSSIFSNEFFADVTYYSPNNLPETYGDDTSTVE